MAKLPSGYKFVISEDSRNVELTKHKVARGFAKIVFSNCAIVAPVALADLGDAHDDISEPQPRRAQQDYIAWAEVCALAVHHDLTG
jgi:hypothetical protein